MRLIAKAIRISRAKFHCNRPTTVQDIQDYASLIFLTHTEVANEVASKKICQLKKNKKLKNLLSINLTH